MARLHTSFVLGYHGCDRVVGERVLAGDVMLAQSDRDYDWIGPGVYFWEADPRRALEWARWKKERGEYDAPFVIGAAIDLGNCLDLMARDNLELLVDAYRSLKGLHDRGEKLEPMPKNVRGPDKFLRYLDCAVIRHLHYIVGEADLPAFDTQGNRVKECGSEEWNVIPAKAGIQGVHIQSFRDPWIPAFAGMTTKDLPRDVIRSTFNDYCPSPDCPAFDTVRGLFTEGGEAFPGSGFMCKTHVQIAVRTADSIKGFFRVPQVAFEE